MIRNKIDVARFLIYEFKEFHEEITKENARRRDNANKVQYIPIFIEQSLEEFINYLKKKYVMS